MEKFNEDLNNMLKKRFQYFIFYQVKILSINIIHINQLKKNSKKKEPNGYKLLKKYDVLKVAVINKLIVPLSDNNEIKYYVHNEELFDVIHNIHLSIGHGGRNRMENEVIQSIKISPEI